MRQVICLHYFRLLRKSLQKGRFTEPAVEDENGAIARQGDGGLAGQCGGLQGFPAGQIPGRVTVPVKVPGIV